MNGLFAPHHQITTFITTTIARLALLALALCGLFGTATIAQCVYDDCDAALAGGSGTCNDLEIIAGYNCEGCGCAVNPSCTGYYASGGVFLSLGVLTVLLGCFGSCCEDKPRVVFTIVGACHVTHC